MVVAGRAGRSAVPSALFGSLHAASSTDLKRLLAYSTTDNIGLVLLAVGAAGLFDATRHPDSGGA